MNVIDFLKEKSDRLAKNKAELIDLINPPVREYFNEALSNAKSSQWLNWAMDQAKITSGSDVDVDVVDRSWAHVTNASALSMFSWVSSNINEITFTGEWLTIDQTRINQFADVTMDQQWIHTEPKRAEKESPFRSTIAHGFLTLSLIPKLVGAVDPASPPYPGAKMVVNMGLNQVRYPYPVKVGSRIRATKKVIDVKTVRRGLELTEEITIEIEGCRRPACVAQVLILLVY